MKTKFTFLILVCFFLVSKAFSQEELKYLVFDNTPINFGGEKGKDSSVVRLQNGRIIYKKITVPKFLNGTDVKIKLTLRSNGDRWDKSGSCFVVTHPDEISILNVSKGEKQFPKASNISDKFKGVLASKNYKPAIELLRFMTPFGVGYYSDNKVKYRRPVYIPKWEKEVYWEQDISPLSSIVSGTFYVGVWVDSWTKEGYSIDLSFSYSNRTRKKLKIIPLVNTIAYVEGQSYPDFFATSTLKTNFELKKDVKKAKLYYTVTGHGGHSGGDEFIKIKNSIFFDKKMVLDTIPWRDDCASFRRFNPSSGVWLKKDSVSYLDVKSKTYKIKEIEERIASSDLSRSNWCPGSKIQPLIIELGDLRVGKHTLEIIIPATKAGENKFNHWLVSNYITFED